MKHLRDVPVVRGSRFLVVGVHYITLYFSVDQMASFAIVICGEVGSLENY